MFPHLFTAYIFEWFTDVRRRAVPGNRTAHESGGYLPVKTSDFLIPAMLILSHFFGLTGILMAGPTADALAFVLSGAFCFKEIKKMEQMGQNIEAQ